MSKACLILVQLLPDKLIELLFKGSAKIHLDGIEKRNANLFDGSQTMIICWHEPEGGKK